MNGLLINGVYDLRTFETLKEKGIKEISFDLRGKSRNLVTYKDLQLLLKAVTTEHVYLVFEDDKVETVKSYLNLLQNFPSRFTLIFRDAKKGDYYKEVGELFYWMFTPCVQWKEILSLSNCKGVILPMNYQEEYVKTPQLWDLIEEHNLEVYIHAENFEQSLAITKTQDVKLSIDLTSEVEKSYRCIDQEKLKKIRIGRGTNENFIGQR